MSTYGEKKLIEAIKGIEAFEAVEFGDRIKALKEIIDLASDMIDGEVAAARANGWSWAQIAPALGSTRQGAQQRYGRSND